ncbi:MAG: DNA helicase II [Gammaproteobacteria bacterium]|nr:DNA helicase II [Gammaproteobacteria bacterium]
MSLNYNLDDLNEAQRDAVCNLSQNSLVIAGAGSGKTRVLIQRILWLVEDNEYSPFSILAVTFTNKAAKEIKSRLSESLDISIDSMWVGTFHGICYRILRANYQKVSLPKNFQIIDTDDQVRIIKRIMKDNEIDNSQVIPKQVAWYINKKKDQSVRSAKVKDDDFISIQYNKIYKIYEEYCNDSGLVDFGEIILRTLELFKNNSEAKSYYHSLFKSILIDEFQDTNTIQYELIKIMSSNDTSIFAVGDDDQSIYGWRGAKIENIEKLQKDFKNTEVFRLEQNYRSTGNILNAANSVILNNNSRMGKNLWTEDKSGDPIKIFSATDGFDEAIFVVETINKHLLENYKRSEIAILYRSNAQSRVFEDKLIARGIKYKIYGGFRFFERAEIKDVMAYMRLAATNNDNNSFERIVNTPPRGIGEKTKELLREFSKENKTSLYDSIPSAIEKSIFPKKAGELLMEFHNLISQVKSILEKDDLPHQINEIIKISNIKSIYEKNKTEQAISKLENLDELISAAEEFTNTDLDENETIIDAFLTHTSLEAGEGQGNEWEECVQLMTLHSSKGLEFPIVFLVGLEENLFPSRMSLEANNLEEERRLCYVGITRARKKLYISHAQMRRQYGSDNYCLPSRFLNELPEEVIEEIGYSPKKFFKRDNRMNKNTYKESSMIGKRVIHKKFGEGMVTSTEGSDSNTRVQISFDEVGTKWLILAIANLEII